MMKHFSLGLLFALSSAVAYPAVSTVKTLVVDGVERTSLVVTPESLAQPELPLLLVLHPNGYTVQQAVDEFGVEKVCDDLQMVVVVPQALDEQNSEVVSLQKLAEAGGYELDGFSLKYVWNAGARVSVSELTSFLTPQQSMFLPMLFPDISSTGYVSFNKDVDDVKFLNALLDDVGKNHPVDSERVFVMGASMGGAMAYRYALSAGTKAKGAVVFCGFVGGNVETDGKIDMPLMVVHSKDDAIVSYRGGMLDIPVAERVRLFAEANGCSEPAESAVEDIADDGISIVRYDYGCKKSKRVRFFEMEGASHHDFLRSDYLSGPNDMDYIAEAYKFLFGEETDEADHAEGLLSFSPNPAADEVVLSCQGSYGISTLSGVMVQSGFADGSPVSVAGLPKGVYLLSVENSEGKWVSKLIKE